ncbi:MAG: hypothetical protein KAT28_00610 [Candidatus Aenigmarchaeota archaeon]|nr:hypothetical protein [Candidatus Aenigmarchaeota archaeon]
MTWETIERPGYFGKKRNELYTHWDEQFGQDNWRIAWEFGENYFSKIPALELVYTTGYYEDLRANPYKVEFLKKWKDVWDTAKTNIDSGLDFGIQETPNNHYHDIAIRRSLKMLGISFEGKELLHIRWKNSKGFDYNPAMTPFHRPDLTPQEPIKDYGNKGFWWEKGIDNSIEEWYQRAKVLQIQK